MVRDNSKHTKTVQAAKMGCKMTDLLKTASNGSS